MAAHCSGCVFATVSVHLDGLNAEQILSMDHHTWPLIIYIYIFFYIDGKLTESSPLPSEESSPYSAKESNAI